MNQSTKTGKKSTVVGMIAGIIAFIIAYYGVQLLFKEDVGSELKKGAATLNQQTPMQIDAFTRLDSAAAKGKTHFIYYYTLVQVEKSEVNLDTVQKYIRPTLIKGVANSADLKPYRDLNITFDYRYYDKRGDFVTEISVTPELYQKQP